MIHGTPLKYAFEISTIWTIFIVSIVLIVIFFDIDNIKKYYFVNIKYKKITSRIVINIFIYVLLCVFIVNIYPVIYTMHIVSIICIFILLIILIFYMDIILQNDADIYIKFECIISLFLIFLLSVCHFQLM